MKCRICNEEASSSITVGHTELIEVTNFYCNTHFREVMKRRGLEER